MDKWNPEQYLKFEALRRRPYEVLAELALGRGPFDEIVDLGCGHGALTIDLWRQAAQSNPSVRALGIDTSKAMLERAAAAIDEFAKDELTRNELTKNELTKDMSAKDRAELEAAGGAEGVPSEASASVRAEPSLPVKEAVHFEEADIREFLHQDRAATHGDPSSSEDRRTLYFSNAALHWLEDHPKLIGELAAQLDANDILAVQVPANDSHPSHASAATLAQTPEWAEKLGGFHRISPVLPAMGYAQLLHEAGFDEIEAITHVFSQYLPSRDHVVEWVRGSVLTAYESRLTASEFKRFVSEYTALLFTQIRDESPFFYPYNRVFFVARKGPA